MKITIDENRCCGPSHSALAWLPAFYELDDLGYAVPVHSKDCTGMDKQALAGANACPEHAITVE